MTGSHDVRSSTGARSVNQIVALAFGVIYTLVGIWGFFVADTFAEQTDDRILGLFMVNHLHNIVHLLIGIALIVAAKRVDTARGANLAIGVTYLVLAVAGPFINDTALDVIALNTGDNWLHLASGLLLAGVALLADKKTRTRA